MYDVQDMPIHTPRKPCYENCISNGGHVVGGCDHLGSSSSFTLGRLASSCSARAEHAKRIVHRELGQLLARRTRPMRRTFWSQNGSPTSNTCKTRLTHAPNNSAAPLCTTSVSFSLAPPPPLFWIPPLPPTPRLPSSHVPPLPSSNRRPLPSSYVGPFPLYHAWPLPLSHVRALLASLVRTLPSSHV